jgi:hypothetical protein
LVGCEAINRHGFWFAFLFGCEAINRHGFWFAFLFGAEVGVPMQLEALHSNVL